MVGIVYIVIICRRRDIIMMIEVIVTETTRRMWELIEEYFTLGGNEKIPAIKKFLNEMKKERARLPEGPENVWFDNIILAARLDLALRRGLRIKKHCKYTEPILVRLDNQEDWIFIDIRILNCALHVTTDIERGLRLLKKALKILKDKYSDMEVYKRAVICLKYNFCHSLLKVYYLGLYKDNSPINIKKLFDELSNEVLALSNDEEFYFYNANIRARQALFNNKIGSAERIVDELKNKGYKDVAERLEDEIAHYDYLVNNRSSDVVNKMFISQKIRYIREMQDLTQEGFAHMADISTSAVSEAENQRTLMSITTLERVAKAFDMEVKDFLSEEIVPIKKNEKSFVIKKINKNLDAMDEKKLQFANKFIELLSDSDE